MILRFFLPLVPFLGLLAAWQLSAQLNPNAAFTTGSPSGFWNELKTLTSSGQLFSDSLITLSEAIFGFILGTVAGSVVGLSLWSSRLLSAMWRPYLIALGAMPIFALGPMLIFWFGTGLASKVALVFLTTFAIASIQAYRGALQADENLCNLTRAFGATRGQLFWEIIVPSSIIWVLAGIQINIGMSLVAAVVGEFISSRAGLGHMIVVAEGLYNVNRMWLGIATLSLLALILNAFVLPVERWARRFEKS